MNSLYDTYNLIKEFAEGHNMINEFRYVKTEQELQHLEFEYRSMIVMPLEANISRELNNPVYTLEFAVVILDKVSQHSDLESVMSTEENIFVVGQLQDYLIQNVEDVSFGEVDLYTAIGGDYNITSATADFSVTIARKPYTKHIDNQ